MNSITFDKLRSNKALALNESARDADGHFTELTFQFSKSNPDRAHCRQRYQYPYVQMKMNINLSIGDRANLLPIHGHKIEVARNQFGYILIVDERDTNENYPYGSYHGMFVAWS